jgi:hypothetical protein
MGDLIAVGVGFGCRAVLSELPRQNFAFPVGVAAVRQVRVDHAAGRGADVWDDQYCSAEVLSRSRRG